ncbi:MAG: sigma factor-like helix-turn-helix DNA-binding protein [Bacillota bacterium]
MCKGDHLDRAQPEIVHRLSVLRDLYEGILPPRQREVVAMRLDEDLSLAEMSERLGVSRQACEDALKRAQKALLDMENRLGFAERVEREEACFREIEKTLSRMTMSDWRARRDSALNLIRNRREGGETDHGV